MELIKQIKNFFSLSEENDEITLSLMEVFENDDKTTLLFLENDQYYIFILDHFEKLSCVLPDMTKLYKYYESYFLDWYKHAEKVIELQDEYRRRKIRLVLDSENELIELYRISDSRPFITIDLKTYAITYSNNVMADIEDKDSVYEKMEDTINQKIEFALEKYIKKRKII